MAALSQPLLVRILLRKTPAEVATIQASAEAVAVGLTTTISALGQSATLSIEDAGVWLAACEEVLTRREADPAATTGSIPSPTLGHNLRQSGAYFIA